MSARSSARRVADDELLIIRTIDAPVALVFRIWSEAEHVKHWLGPEGFACTSVDLDFRPGGAWRACIESESLGPLWMSGRYREIERDKRIVYTFAWEDHPDEQEIETLVTVTFAEEDGKTVQTFHQAPFLDVRGRDSHVEGWNSSFDREQTYAETLRRKQP